jgi:alanine--tRNA ligase
MGLERLAVVVQDVGSIFEVDTIKSLLDEVAKAANTSYKLDEKKDISLRLITDHIRSCTFMISDGIMPSNEGRGYVLRRLLRRAARHGKMLGISEVFLAKLAETVIELSKDGYPELETRKDMILRVLTEEENKFNHTINQGLSILNEITLNMQANNIKTMSGEDAFKLYDTYGFPIDLTKEIMAEKGLSIDEEGFKKAMTVQKESARAARKSTNYMGADITVYQSLNPALTSKFVGYDHLETVGTIIAITSDTEVTQALTENEHGTIITDTTPFYATMGGQQADKGVIVGETGEFVVEDTIKLQGDKFGHIGYVRKGMLIVDEVVSLKVDVNRRKEIAKNHSATHLLHKALRLVLGTHVEQAGSLVDEDRLRFDFTHFAALTQEEIKKIEDIVNEEILAAIPVTTEVMKLSDAKKSGAMALFGEKYKDDVRVVSMADFSKELCGGTHVENTADIQNFKIISESGIAAGVRRIEALTSKGLLNYYENLENAFSEVAKELKSTMFESGDRVKSLLEEVKHLKSENEKLKAKLANNALSDANESTFEIKNVKLILMKVEGIEINELRNLGDKLKNETNGGVVVLASVVDSKVNLLVMAGDEAIKKGIHAGNIIKNIAKLVGGGGGGRPNMAQAGGTNPSGIDDAFELAKKVLEEQIA